MGVYVGWFLAVSYGADIIAKSMARHQAIALDLGICKTQLLTVLSGHVAGGSSSRSESFLSLRTGAAPEKWKCDGQLIAFTTCMANHLPLNKTPGQAVLSTRISWGGMSTQWYSQLRRKGVLLTWLQCAWHGPAGGKPAFFPSLSQHLEPRSGGGGDLTSELLCCLILMVHLSSLPGHALG